MLFSVFLNRTNRLSVETQIKLCQAVEYIFSLLYCISLTTDSFIMFVYIDNVHTVLVQTCITWMHLFHVRLNTIMLNSINCFIDCTCKQKQVMHVQWLSMNNMHGHTTWHTLAKIGFANNYIRISCQSKITCHYHHCNYPIGISFSTSQLQVGCLSNIHPLNFHGHYLATCQLSRISHETYAFAIVLCRSCIQAHLSCKSICWVGAVTTPYTCVYALRMMTSLRKPRAAIQFPLSIFHFLFSILLNGALIRTFTKS